MKARKAEVKAFAVEYCNQRLAEEEEGEEGAEAREEAAPEVRAGVGPTRWGCDLPELAERVRGCAAWRGGL